MPESFQLDGIEYDVAVAAQLRKDLVDLRNESLQQNEFEWAVKLSHIIAMYSMMAEHIWQDEWRKLAYD